MLCLRCTLTTFSLINKRLCRRPDGTVTFLWVLGTNQHARKKAFYDFPLDKVLFANQHRGQYDLFLVTSIRSQLTHGQGGPSLTRYVILHDLCRRHCVKTYLGLTDRDAAVSLKTLLIQFAVHPAIAILEVVAKSLAASTSPAQSSCSK